MTEKRYRMSYGDEQVIIDSFEKNSFSPYYEGVSRIVNRLNEQHEQIERLKRNFKALDKVKCEIVEENEQLKSKNRGLQSELQIFKEDVTHSNLQINKLADENEQLKQQLRDKEVEWLRNNTVWEQMPTSKPTVAKTTLSDDFNQSNCITVQKSIISDLKKENEQLKQTMQEVAELLSEEVDLFSDKATEHDICAYVELKELDNKDAFYMATATKKAIQMLKELQE